MNGDCIIKISLSRAHFDGDAESLEDLVTTEADDMQADDALLLTDNDELIGGGWLMFGHGVVHICEARDIGAHVILAVLSQGLRFCQADGARGWVRENDGRNVLVLKLGIVKLGGAEETVRKPAAGGDGDYRIWCKSPEKH